MSSTRGVDGKAHECPKVIRGVKAGMKRMKVREEKARFSKEVEVLPG